MQLFWVESNHTCDFYFYVVFFLYILFYDLVISLKLFVWSIS